MLKNPLYTYGDQHSLKIPAHLNYGRHVLGKYGDYGDIEAIINTATGESLTFKELSQQIVDIALSLVRMGVRKGDVVGVCSEKRLEFIPTVLGIICAGATFTAVDVTGGRATILHRTDLAKPSVLFCSPSAYEVHRETIKLVKSIEKVILYEDGNKWDDVIEFDQFLVANANVEDFLPVDVKGWADVAVILYSSGTTGLPKGIPLTHLNLILILGDIYMEDESVYAETRTLITREWYYSYGFLHTLLTLSLGSTILYCPNSDERSFLEAVQNYKIQMVQLAPATVTNLLNSSLVLQYDVSSLVNLISCSTHFSAEMVDAIKDRLPKLRGASQYYGMSEAGCICSDRRAPKGQKGGSVGIVTEAFIVKTEFDICDVIRPLELEKVIWAAQFLGISMRVEITQEKHVSDTNYMISELLLPMLSYISNVVDLNTREPLGPNQRGEICFKSPSLMLGYIGDTSTDYIDEEGFFKTGDIGYYDEDRYFFIVDRIKELIKFNSYQVSPAELEMVLARHPAVLSSGVAGAPHDEYGEAPTAFVVLRPECEATGEELVKFVDGQVSYRMRLAGGVRFVDDLPTIANGKLDRKALKKILK